MSKSDGKRGREKLGRMEEEGTLIRTYYIRKEYIFN